MKTAARPPLPPSSSPQSFSGGTMGRGTTESGGNGGGGGGSRQEWLMSATTSASWVFTTITLSLSSVLSVGPVHEMSKRHHINDDTPFLCRHKCEMFERVCCYLSGF